VLARPVSGPARHLEDDALRPRRLVDELDHRSELPAQSPA
jgi:hypothetical protein